MDCAAPASFTHTHTPYAVCTPLLAKRAHWRRAKRTGGSSFFSSRHPPSANQCNWRKGSNSSRETHILTIGKRHLAKWKCLPAKSIPGGLEPSRLQAPVGLEIRMILHGLLAIRGWVGCWPADWSHAGENNFQPY